LAALQSNTNNCTLKFAGGRVLDLGSAKVMGVLNVTSDSFSDGGRFNSKAKAVKHALKMFKHGAAIVDIGGESTRPGARQVSVDEEITRVISIIKAIRQETGMLLSVDTSKPEVMVEAVQAGADMINDVRALHEPGALAIAAETKVPVCVMHMQGQPATMQQNPDYNDVVSEVKDYLLNRVEKLVNAGIKKNRIIIDPGFGFGKTLKHNLELLRNLDILTSLQFPVLAGISRKSMLGAILDIKSPRKRLFGSLSAAVIAAMHGARIIRVHDVKATVQALKVVAAVRG